MSQVFTRGQKSPLSALTTADDLYVGIHLDAPGLTWDVSCFGLDAGNKLSDDAYFIFFNQPASPEGAIRQLGPQSGDTDSFRAVLSKVPEKIAKLSFCAAVEGVRHGQQAPVRIRADRRGRAGGDALQLHRRRLRHGAGHHHLRPVPQGRLAGRARSGRGSPAVWPT